MVGQITSIPFLPHVALELFFVGLEQIDQQQSVDNVAEIVVAVKGEDLAAEVEVMAQQYRYSLAVCFHVADQHGEVVDIFFLTIDPSDLFSSLPSDGRGFFIWVLVLRQLWLVDFCAMSLFRYFQT